MLFNFDSVFQNMCVLCFSSHCSFMKSVHSCVLCVCMSLFISVLSPSSLGSLGFCLRTASLSSIFCLIVSGSSLLVFFILPFGM